MTEGMTAGPLLKTKTTRLPSSGEKTERRAVIPYVCGLRREKRAVQVSLNNQGERRFSQLRMGRQPTGYNLKRKAL